MQQKIKNRIVLIIKGMAMGTADVIPGVSGGTVAFVTGIYERLIMFLGSIGVNEGKAVLQIFAGSNQRQQGLQTIKSLDWEFFLPLLTGIVLAILSLSKVMVYTMEVWPVQTYAFFFGLILISIKFPFVEMKKSPLNYLIIIITAALAFLFFSISGNYQGDVENFTYVFFAGAIAVCALILPGISGSTFLVILGMYKPILNAIHNRDLLTIGIFLSGMTVGILSFVRLLKWLLQNYHSYTMAALTGLMLGSLKKVWPLDYVEGTLTMSVDVLSMSAFIFMGAILVFGLEWLSRQSHA